jgi:hypothetical protein
MLWILTLPPVAAAIKIADIRLAHDGDFGSLVFHRFVTTGRSSGRDSQNSSDNKLYREYKNIAIYVYANEILFQTE